MFFIESFCWFSIYSRLPAEPGDVLGLLVLLELDTISV